MIFLKVFLKQIMQRYGKLKRKNLYIKEDDINNIDKEILKRWEKIFLTETIKEEDR
jgi:hypothetical protein